MKTLSHALTAILVGSLILATDCSAAEPVDYLKQVKPLLTRRCFTCHGNLKQQGGLRVDTAGLIAKGGESGPALVAGKSGESLLIQALNGTNGLSRMPLDGEPLSAEEIALIAAWIDQGAAAPEEKPPEDPKKHWSFQPPQRPALPQPANAAWVRTPIDAFLAADHEKRGLQPAPPAGKNVLLRRVYLDLVGLPPSRQELQDFLEDSSYNAYDQVVERLLASPQYGERWGRHWMDVWRYSDWAGFANEIRESQRHIWRWRDWIVESLNQDKPYDRMIVEMLAGDELAPDDPQIIRATGFLGRNWYKFNRNVWLDNTIEHTSKAFLGVTMNCCRCHDHMYDPIAQQEYYRFRAFFEPYDIRTDRVPGQANVELDGLSRVYDANAAAPTHLFVRGDEKNADKEHPLEPGLPAILTRVEPATVIQPVALPVKTYYPGLNAFVQQETLAAAQADVTKAQQALTAAEQSVAALKQKQADLAAGTTSDAARPFLSDNFSAAQPDVWEIGDGKWEYVESRLRQSAVGAKDCLLTAKTPHPRDFSATVKFRITGGEMWKSVGLMFDRDELQDFDAVYLSAVDGGSKVQVYLHRAGGAAYPPEGMKPLPVELNKDHTLRVDIRDRLLNVAVDGKLLVAYKLPHERGAGRFALWTFDAAAEFSSVHVTPLPAAATLLEKADGQLVDAPAPNIEAELAAAAGVAALNHKQLAAAQSAAAAVQARIAADNARYAAPPAAEADALSQAAGQAEAAAAVSKAEADLLIAEQQLATAQKAVVETDEKSKQAATAAETKLNEAKTRLTAAQQTLANPPATYAALGPVYPATSSGRRLALARWIADRQNPLVARVAVNHLWLRHFGEPLVPTVFDFGLNGKPPVNPELLDWLAVEFMDHGWSMKHLHRLMVLSNAYRMQSTSPADNPNLTLDRDNKYLWRMRPRRLEAEAVRDSVLHVAGRLDTSLSGPDIDYNEGLTNHRRSIYFRHANEKQMTFLLLFDVAGVTECYRRNESVVPQQALALANSSLALAEARVLAGKLSQELAAVPADEASAAFVTAAFEQILTRHPSLRELTECLDFLNKQSEQLAARDKLSPFTAGAANAVPPSADPRQRARENLIHVLLNHNDFVTIR